MNTTEHEQHQHCGCCGDCLTGAATTDWCKRCVRHVGRHHYVPPWDRTYEALHASPCPFQVEAS